MEPFKKFTTYQDMETTATDSTPIAMDKTDNEVLAEFMGLAHRRSDFFRDNPVEVFTKHWEFPRYLTSWNWLMPVWYKFRDLKMDLALHDYKTYKQHWYELANDIPRKPIEHVFKALVEAIKWYNTVKK
jgi:hypothetical protein